MTGRQDRQSVSFATGLPVSMQLVERFFDDPLLMRVAYAYQHSTDWDQIISVQS